VASGKAEELVRIKKKNKFDYVSSRMYYVASISVIYT